VRKHVVAPGGLAAGGGGAEGRFELVHREQGAVLVQAVLLDPGTFGLVTPLIF
jgi:hypothetical protein